MTTPGEISVRLIRAYQILSRALAGARFPMFSWTGCRQWPTCSEYAIHSIRTRGLVRGGCEATRRMFRCNPFMRVA